MSFFVLSISQPVLAASDQMCVCKNDTETSCRSFKAGEGSAPASFAGGDECAAYCNTTYGITNAKFTFLENVPNAEFAIAADACSQINVKTYQDAKAINQPTSTTSANVSTTRSAVIPVLNVPIPGLTFAAPTKKGDNIVVNFLSTYINAIYKLLIGASIAIAIVMLMIGGFQYSFGAVSTAQIEAAKERIRNAVVGLVLLFGTFILLYTVNPQLTLLSPLNLFYTEPNPIDFAEFDKDDPLVSSNNTVVTPGQNRSLQDPIFDDIFKGFANCVKIDWRVLKGVAFLESKLNNSIKNSIGFTGLFQTKPANCKDYLRNDPDWKTQCSNLTDPVINTAVGVRSIDGALKIVERYCPKNISPNLKGMMVYYAHNSGNGALQQALKGGGCKGENEFLAAIDHWWTVVKSSPQKSATRQSSARKASGFISTLGVSDFRDTSANGSAACPLDGPPPTSTTISSASCNTSGSKILAVGDSITANNNSYSVQLERTCSQVTVTRKAIAGKSVTWMDEQVTAASLSGQDYLIILGGVNDMGSSVASITGKLEQIYDRAKASNVKVVAITLNPWKGYSTWSPEKHQKTLAVNAWIKSQQGSKVDYVVDFYELVKDPQDPEQLAPAYNSNDHLHPTAAAHTVLMNAIIKTIYP